MVGAALEDRNSWCGLIVDGFHAHPASFRVALSAKPRGKLFLVTDAMPPVGGEREGFELGGRRIVCRNGRCTDASDTLAGSALDMAAAVRRTAADLDVGLEEALRMAGAYPADFLGLETTRGRMEPGLAADLVALDQHGGVVGTWIAGRCIHPHRRGAGGH